MSKNDIIETMSKKETSQALKRAKAKYKEKSVETLRVDLFPTDEDIKEHLKERVASGEPKATYIKRIIREDIKRGDKQ